MDSRKGGDILADELHLQQAEMVRHVPDRRFPATLKPLNAPGGLDALNALAVRHPATQITRCRYENGAARIARVIQRAY